MNNSKTSDKLVSLPSTREILRDCVAMVNNLVIDHASADESNLCTRNHLLINLARVQANLERGEKREPQLGTLGLARDAYALLLQLRLNSDSTNVRCRREVLDKLSEIQMKAEIAESRIWIEIGRDGDQWCALVGENIQEGASGFGAKPMAALRQLVIVQGVDCAEELARQATKLMPGGKLVENVVQGLAAEMADHYLKMGVPDAAPPAAEVPAKFWGPTHRYNVFAEIAKRFVRQHVVTDSEDAFRTVVDQLISLMDAKLAPYYNGHGQIMPSIARLREENERLVTELKTEKEFSQKLAVEVNQKNETIGALHKERDAYQKDRDHALAQLDGANSRVVAERAVAEEQSNARETATKELIDVRARLSQAMSRIEQLMKERDDVVAQRQTAWAEIRRLQPESFNKPVLVPHANSGSVASPTPPEFPKICVPSDNFFHSAACEYLKLRGETVVNNAQVAHEVVRLRDQFLRDHVLSVTYQHETL